MKKQFLVIQLFLSLGLVDATAQTITTGKNAIMEQTPREAMTTLSGSTYKNVQSSIGYFDGLGKSTQTILYRGSADASKDLITSTALYDIFGRNYKNILPVASDGSTGGFSTQSETLASAFYNDTKPFTEITLYENSPMNRPLNAYGVGQNWRTNSKFVESKYQIANSGTVLLFNVTSTGATLAGTYAANQLTKDIVVSEQGNEVVEYKDKDGKIIQRDVQDGVGTYLSVLFIYDDFDRLRYVIQPKALIKFGTAPLLQSFSEGDVIFKEGIFGYVYDKQSRIIEKKIPGAGTHFYVYDKNDRVVVHADETDKANDYWQFNKYDIFGRILYQGLIKNIGSYTRSQIQTDFDNFAYVSTNIIYEERGTTLLGYTNRSFPSSYAPSEPNTKLVTYYDNYTWNSDLSFSFQAVNAFHAQSNAKGLITGTLIRNLETNDWYKFINYFDEKLRNIQTHAQNHLGGIDRMDYQYRFNGEVLKMRNTHKKAGEKDLVELYEYSYDHAGRKTSFTHNSKVIAKYEYDAIGRIRGKKFSPAGTALASSQTGNWNNTSTWQSGVLPLANDNVTINTGQTVTIPNGEIGSAGTLNDYGTLNNFGTLNMGKYSTVDLYSQTFSHHIRGSLLGINLDNAGNLTNSLFSFKLGFETENYFDGNIGKQEWKSSLDNVNRSFTYTYDKSSRISAGLYNSTKVGENYSLNSVTYDENGNIKTLSRSGATNSNFTTFGNVDNLTYTYSTNSNKLLKVQDTTVGNTDLGDFRDGTNTNDDYEYEADGSLKRDRNKGIDSIYYNYLKLVRRVKFSNGSWINYQYDVNGKKLRKTTSQGITTDYVGNKIYDNNILYQTSHDEGRINAQGIYEYNITDHLGNLRVSFKDSLGIAVPIQSVFYDPWGLSMKGMSITRNLTNFNKFQFLNRETQFETGYIDLIHRLLDPQTGRFLSTDPVTNGQEHLSLYQYGWNNPILKSDPNGLIPPQDDSPSTMRRVVAKTQNQAAKAQNAVNQTKQSASEIVTVTGGVQVAGIGGGVKVGSVKVQADVKLGYAEASVNKGDSKVEAGLAKMEVKAEVTKTKSLGGSVTLASGTASSKDGYSENGGFQAGSSSVAKGNKSLNTDGDIGINGKLGNVDVGVNISSSRLVETGKNLISSIVETGKTMVEFLGNYMSETFNQGTNNTFSGGSTPSQERKK